MEGQYVSAGLSLLLTLKCTICIFCFGMSISFDDIPDHAYDTVIREMFGDRALKENGEGYNFVCPVCGDMAFPNKKKAYVYKNSWKYVCYKCNESMHFMQYLKENDKDKYSRLLFYAFDNEPSEPRKPKVTERKNAGLPFAEGELLSVMDNNPLSKLGLELCKSRRIRPEVYESWFVCQSGEQFYRRDPSGNYIINPNTGFPYGNEYKDRLIIPYYRFGGKWNQFDARALDPNNQLRYRNFEGEKRTAYNVDFVDFSKPFYILEGSIDSTFIRNSIAIGGIKHLGEVLADNPEIEAHKDNCVMLWDNDDAGRKAMWDTINRGFKWFDWTGVRSKDVNSAVMNNELMVDSSGYVSTTSLDGRVKTPGTAAISFVLQYGNVEKQAFKDKMAKRRVANQLRQKNEDKVYF